MSSPRAWGCFQKHLVLGSSIPVFPSCVGVFPRPAAGSVFAWRLPHVRGGVSVVESRKRILDPSSPRAWGCFLGVRRRAGLGSVFPTCVGVFLFRRRGGSKPLCLPHVRGGVSVIRKNEARAASVFPTCVGVFLAGRLYLGRMSGLPHVRGGVSLSSWAVVIPIASSPRAWGCFLSGRTSGASPTVFPTCVGVFLKPLKRNRPSACLPHVRGGVSPPAAKKWRLPRSSPRAWGCFPAPQPPPPLLQVFPTCVGVFHHGRHPLPRREGLPHVRGGVSRPKSFICATPSSSPRAWGCFEVPTRWRAAVQVFPTCVGVFLPVLLPWYRLKGLPHVRGGVSQFLQFLAAFAGSSPRAWGCFLFLPKDIPDPPVFPTCVGVFHIPSRLPAWPDCLPHVRGGVSYSPDMTIPPELSSPRAWGCFHRHRPLLGHDPVFPTCVGCF